MNQTVLYITICFGLSLKEKKLVLHACMASLPSV